MSLQPDIWRLCALGLVGLVVGVLLGYPSTTLLLLAVGYIVWLYRRLRGLELWVRDRQRHQAPEVPGVFESICREIDFFRDRHRRRRRRLTTYLKQFQAATAALPDATVVLDERGVIRWANTAATENLGVRWPEDEGQRLTNLLRHPDIIPLLESRSGAERSFELASPRRPEIQLSLRMVPYGDERRLLIARDVTRLNQLNQVRSDFVANVSHELRTPLTVLMGYLETLAANVNQCPPAWTIAVEQMQKSTIRMGAIVEDLLLLSRLEQEDPAVPMERVYMPEMLAQIFRDAQALSGDDRHLISIEVDHDLHIRGRANELHSAFSNLVVNAIRYTPARGVIRIAWYADDAGAHFRVTDTGIGIPADHLPRITERFYRVERSRARSRGGTGLGLAIVKHVLNRHGATLHIQSEVGKGSVFRCDFPPGHILSQPNPTETQDIAG